MLMLVFALLMQGPDGLDQRIRAAERIVVGQVRKADPVPWTSPEGDQLHVTRVILQVEEVLKGQAGEAVLVNIVGGTVNGITLQVSDTPIPKVNSRLVLFTKGEQPVKGQDVLDVAASREDIVAKVRARVKALKGQ